MNSLHDDDLIMAIPVDINLGKKKKKKQSDIALQAENKQDQNQNHVYPSPKDPITNIADEKPSDHVYPSPKGDIDVTNENNKLLSTEKEHGNTLDHHYPSPSGAPEENDDNTMDGQNQDDICIVGEQEHKTEHKDETDDQPIIYKDKNGNRIKSGLPPPTNQFNIYPLQNQHKEHNSFPYVLPNAWLDWSPPRIDENKRNVIDANGNRKSQEDQDRNIFPKKPNESVFPFSSLDQLHIYPSQSR